MQTRKIAAALVLGLAILAAGASAQEPTPQYGKWGFDLAGADKKAQPGDDFFRYANGTWLDQTAIPADKPGYSLRLAMTDQTEQRLRDIMFALAPHSGIEDVAGPAKACARNKRISFLPIASERLLTAPFS